VCVGEGSGEERPPSLSLSIICPFLSQDFDKVARGFCMCYNLGHSISKEVFKDVLKIVRLFLF